MGKVLIIYGGWSGHTPKETAEVFESILKKEKHNVILSDTLDILNSFDDIRDVDLFIPVWTMGEITPVQEKNILRAIAEGAGIAGCHGGMCDSFRNSTGWQFMSGAQWVAHPGNGGVTYMVNLKNGSLFTEGLQDFSYTGEQYYIHIDPSVTIHATTTFPIAEGEHSTNGTVAIPVIFTKKWGKGKVFYFSIGHNYKDFENENIREITSRGMLWAMRGK